jgi:hypothetical protein
MRQNILIFGGILGIIFGTLFLLQGLGVIRYPVTSPMVGNHLWVVRGGIIALLSAVVVAGVRLVPAKGRKGNPET